MGKVYAVPNVEERAHSLPLASFFCLFINRTSDLSTIESDCLDKSTHISIDQSDFFRGTAEKDSRSLMNVTFRLPNEELEAKFVSEAQKADLQGLKGHRSVGGCRASIYNATTKEAVQALVDLMKTFEQKNG